MNLCLVAPSPRPFVMGGAEKLFLGLVSAVNEHTRHRAELVKIPVEDQSFFGLVSGYAAFARLDLSHFDLVLSTKYPAWAVRHKNHHVYLQHKLRGFYDLWDVVPAGLEDRIRPRADAPPPDHPALDRLLAMLERPRPGAADVDDVLAEVERLGRSGLPPHLFAFPGPLIRRVVRFLDAATLSPEHIASHSAISRTVANRPDYFPPGVDAAVLHHPTHLRGLKASPGGNTVFTSSRLADMKRVHLVVEAYRRVPGDTPLLIAGTGAEAEALRRRAAGDRRVRFLGYVPDEALAGLYGAALFVPFVPYDEDWGLVAPEAMACGAPVLTAADSGGPTELVSDGVTGRVVPPAVEALAEAMTGLLARPEETAAMGRAAARAVAGLTWPRFVADLLERLEAPRGVPWRARPRALVLSTFPAHPAVSGGQLRVLHLARALARCLDVTLLALGPPGAVETRQTVAPGVVQHVVPMTRAQHQAALALEERLGAPAADLMVMDHWDRNPALLAAMAEALAGARLAVLEHPYLAPALLALSPACPVVLDAHNVEADLKAPLLAGAPGLAARLQEVEALACRSADLVLCCCGEDAGRLAQRYGVPRPRLVEVRNGVDLAGAVRLGGDEARALRARLGVHGPLAVFVAASHPPNVAAARRLLAVADELPEWSFVVAGSVQAHFEGEPLPGNVRFTGVLSEREKGLLLACADVALNPMTEGSGTNLKVPDALAHGTPVLTTPFGRRGLPDLPGMAEAEAADFAAALRTLDLAGLRRGARDTSALAALDWHAVTAPLRGYAAELALGRGRPPARAAARNHAS